MARSRLIFPRAKNQSAPEHTRAVRRSIRIRIPPPLLAVSMEKLLMEINPDDMDLDLFGPGEEDRSEDPTPRYAD